MERIIIATIILATGLYLSTLGTNEQTKVTGNFLWLGSLIALIVLFIIK